MDASAPPPASLLVDLKVGSLLAREVHHRSIARVLGVPAADQDLLTTVVLTGAVVAGLASLVPRPWAGLTGGDALLGGSVVNAMLRGLAGEPSRTVPLAGTVIVGALVAGSARPAIASSARQLRGWQREARAAFRSWTTG